ncbi:MAG: AMP-binding protein [Acidimicrobiia bacterium]
MLAGQADRVPDRVALTIMGEHITYEGLVARSNGVARGLIELGVGRGDVVAVLAENSAEHVYLQFGVARIGAIEVMINTAYRGEFLAHQLRDSGAKVVLVDEHLLPQALPIVGQVPSLTTVVVLGSNGGLTREGQAHVVDVEVLHAHSGSALLDVEDPTWTDPCTIVYTSGTTGPSKGALMSQNYMCTLAELESSIWYRDENDAFYSCGPLFHLAAKAVGVLGSIYRGVRCVQDERFSSSMFWRRIREEECTATLMLGSMIMLLWGRDPSPEEGIDTVFAVPCPQALQSAMEERWRCTFESAYGLSEAAPVTTSGPDIPLRPGSAGKVATKYYDVRIFDNDDREVEPGEVGEIVIRPRRPHVIFEGYYNNPAATLERWRNLWFHTGDLGRIDGDGYFFFVDRKKDYLRRRGENISSYEVEEAMARHPDVLEAAVVGVQSELTEEDVKAVVVLRQGASVTKEELIQHCIESMPYFAVPRYLEVVDDLPRTPSGKVEKHKLRSGGTADSWDREAAGIVLSGKRQRANTPSGRRADS